MNMNPQTNPLVLGWSPALDRHRCLVCGAPCTPETGEIRITWRQMPVTLCSGSCVDCFEGAPVHYARRWERLRDSLPEQEIAPVAATPTHPH